MTEPDFYAYTLNWPCDPNIFPQRHACLVGIQVIPITAVSKYWVDQVCLFMCLPVYLPTCLCACLSTCLVLWLLACKAYLPDCFLVYCLPVN